MTTRIPRHELTATLKVPAGSYYLGDPSYSLPDSQWMRWLTAANYTETDVLEAPVGSHRVIAFTTLYGDGEYLGSDGFPYLVDRGLLGLVPTALVRDPAVNPPGQHPYPDRIWDGEAELTGNELCRTVTFSEDTFGVYEEGVLRFGEVTIDTGS